MKIPTEEEMDLPNKDLQGARSRAIEICRNLKQSIAKAKKRVPSYLKSNITTNPSASATGLQKVYDRLMKEHDIKKSEL